MNYIIRTIVDQLDAIVAISSQALQYFTRYMDVDGKCDALAEQMELVGKEEDDILGRLRWEERRPGKKRRGSVGLFSEHVKRYIEDSDVILLECRNRQWKLDRMRWLSTIEKYLNRGKILLNKANQIQEEGVVYDKIQTRGERLLVGELMGWTANALLIDVLNAIQNGAVCIGIYGPAGAGKTNIMKHLYNKVYDDEGRFRAVYWVTAPKEPRHNKDIQESVAEGMHFCFNDEDEVRRASHLAMRFKANEDNPGHSVMFLDNVKERFPSYELLGIPSRQTSSTFNSNAILVFTAPSKDVCNMMDCDYTVKMDLLEEAEARELFFHEAGLKDRNQNDITHSKEVIVANVIKQCARMPLAIIVIGRSMIGITDMREWRSRLNELQDLIENIYDDDEIKILEQLKFSYLYLKDEVTKRCFRSSAKLLVDDRNLSKEEIIRHWISQGIISRRGPGIFANDHGHTILNRLERTCLLEVVNVYGSNVVTMNKWIRKMAAIVPDD